MYHLSRVRDTITLADLTQAEKTCPAEFMKFRPLLPLAGMPQELQSGARSPNELTGIFATTHRANLAVETNSPTVQYCWYEMSITCIVQGAEIPVRIRSLELWHLSPDHMMQFYILLHALRRGTV